MPVQAVQRWGEVWFWVLLLGSWIMLNSTAWPNQVMGGFGCVAFVAFAFVRLGRLHAMGMELASWCPAGNRFWALATSTGVAAGLVALWLASAAHERIAVATNWRMLLLQTVLGPVMEEILFRGYLVRFLLWVHGARLGRRLTCGSVVVISACAFGASHILRPGTGFVTIAVITTLGTLYGYIRMASGSTATAAVAHAAYNATLYVGMGI